MTSIAAHHAVRAMRSYLTAKDENRPHRLEDCFTGDAVVEMRVDTGAISFPPQLVGREAIAETLCRQFGQTYENVYTFYLGRPEGRLPEGRFSCDWLVVMSAKSDGSLRVGCGRYDWHFVATANGEEAIAEHLTIGIDAMAVLPRALGKEIRAWAGRLPYP